MPDKKLIHQHVHVNTSRKNDDGSVGKLPHERDASPEDDTAEPRKEIKRAYRDLQEGLVDTDLHGQRGVEEAVRNQNNAKNAPRNKK